ncbi:sigma-70 family RNA polymerase sigma factor [bacterium]|nr:MAG: sigma-70 family RNA polymerase sigma factor [bacterium]
MQANLGAVLPAEALGYDKPEALQKRSPMTGAEFERFVRENQDGALRLAYSYLKDWDDARDAVQEGFVKAYRNASSFRGDSSEKTWFYRIMVNHLKDVLRKRKVREVISTFTSVFTKNGEETTGADHADGVPGPEEISEAHAIRSDFEKALAALPKRQREVATLHLSAGLTLKQAAAALGISEGAAKAHYFRAVRSLREELMAWRETR